MRLSVIISTYNRPHYLERTIEGYLHQTRLPDEIVVADDGSTMDTAKRVGEMAAMSSISIRHVWHEDKGFRAASIRNKAVAASAGEYLIFCDDDSIPACSLVADHLQYAERGYFIQGHRVLLAERISQHFRQKDGTYTAFLLFALQGKAGNVANAFRLPLPLIRRSSSMRGIRSCNLSIFRKDFLAVNGFNEDFVGWGKEDSELVARLYKHGLYRKDLKFRACCFHLYHKHYSRENLEKNIQLLQASVNAPAFCANGVDKYLNARSV
ncbi:MAG TPA: glycosyltransferase family 2 protein [Dissulfurispiraceae bacterium]|nr:glycosyltransferase family 2 protein [Dissulfurispiraceae bacterium]